MANMVIPNVGKLLWLSWALSGSGSTYEDFVVELFQSDTTPDADSVLSDFTISDFPGYEIQTLTRADFSAPAIVSDQAQSTGTPIPTYTCTGGGGQDAYGWVMYGADSATLLAVQRFDRVRNMTNGASEELDPFPIKLDQLA